MVKFGSVKDLARKELSEFLVKYTGKKVLVWDEGLTGKYTFSFHILLKNGSFTI